MSVPAMDFSTLSMKGIEPAPMSAGDPRHLTSRTSGRIDDVGDFIEVSLSPEGNNAPSASCIGYGSITVAAPVASAPRRSSAIQAACRFLSSCFRPSAVVTEPSPFAFPATTNKPVVTSANAAHPVGVIFSSLATVVPTSSMSRAQAATFEQQPRTLGVPWGSAASSGPWGSSTTPYHESVYSFRSQQPGATGSPVPSTLAEISPTAWCIPVRDNFSSSTASTVATVETNDAPAAVATKPPWGRASRLELILREEEPIVMATTTPRFRGGADSAALSARLATVASAAAAQDATPRLKHTDTPSPFYVARALRAAAQTRFETPLAPPSSLLSPAHEGFPTLHRPANFPGPDARDGITTFFSPKAILSARMRAALQEALSAAVAQEQRRMPGSAATAYPARSQLFSPHSSSPHEDIVSC